MSDSPSIWFENDVEYRGIGRAEFADPLIILEGPAKAQFTEVGQPNIEIDFNNIIYGADQSILRLLNRDATTNECGQIINFMNKIHNNKCVKLEITTPEGNFQNISNDIKHYIPCILRSVIKFFILSSQFEAAGTEPKYWVIPLYNFLAYFHKISMGDFHPLSFNNRDLRLIFKLNSNTCLIEPLNDYESRESKLINFQIPKIITSLMIGELRTKLIDFESLYQHVPINFLELLGLAAGTNIGAPWVEFRTEDGTIAKRIHAELNNPIYFKGHVVFEEFWDHGIETFLTNGRSLLHLGNSYMTATIYHLIKAGARNLTTDEKLTHLFQALDCLCETFDLKTQHLNRQLNTSQQKQIKDVLKNARLAIIAISNASTIDTQKQTIRAIAERTSSTPVGTARDFGLSVRDLLMLFNQPDIDIIENYYNTSKGKSWLNYLSHCRGVEIHKGFLDFYEGEFDPAEISIIMAHLHDILIRLIFKMLNYEGIYRSPIQPLPNRKKPDWVNPNTSPTELGY